eukprot:TRINITY_DN29389_c0_g1_i2.p1 TRINITY_DN29389_c0_g1~~TRINITY_DN29389_c0_g1_i2.p1  ORF type:complete len:214 (+),score=24.89 TRINITY_DN29389_c0_g1_i2:98-739(+)
MQFFRAAVLVPSTKELQLLAFNTQRPSRVPHLSRRACCNSWAAHRSLGSASWASATAVAQYYTGNSRRQFSTDSEEYPQIDEFNTLYAAENWRDAVTLGRQLLGKMEGHAQTEADKTLLIRLRRQTGLAHFHLGEYLEAVSIFERVTECRTQEDKVMDWFNLVTAAVLARQPIKAEKAFVRVQKIHEATNHAQQPSLPQIRWMHCVRYTRPCA